jgi:transcriptional regulator with XRE-family HTH domain
MFLAAYGGQQGLLVMMENSAGVETKLWDGAWLRELRLKRGLQVKELAERAGVSPSSITSVEGNHVASPGIIFVLQLTEAMGVPITSVLGQSQEGEEYHSGYTAAMLDMQDALHKLRRDHESGS